jgi:hypothetical protein
MFDSIKKIFSEDEKPLDNSIKETINRWNLNDIDLFLNKKQAYMSVPYNDQVLGEILRRFLEVKRVNGQDEIEPKSYNKTTRKFTIPERTQKVIKLIQKVSKSNALGYKSNERIFAIINKYVTENGKKEYEPELMPYYKMALERIMLKSQVEQELNLEFGNKLKLK